ncbi:MAG: EI24 domain-containing protein [Campylobacterota bacterium]|nr:EI24 domain-containing protein [Campylobacterota bacterium]
MNEKNLFLLSIKDLLTAKMLKYSILPFFVSMIIIYTLFFFLAGMGLEEMGSMDISTTQTTIENGIPHTESFQANLEGSAIIQFLMNYAITSWIASFLVYAIGGFFMLYISIFVALLVIGFLTPIIIKELQFRHYQDVEIIGHSNIAEALFLMLKWAFFMLVMFFLFFPLYFIPLVNIIAFNFPLYYFFHKMLTYDIASTICTREENKKIKFFNSTNIKLKTAFLYILSLIPFVIFFASVFFIIYLGHTYFEEAKKIRQN